MKVRLEDGTPMLFVCDRKACGETCPNELCSHTEDILHAKNFQFINVNDCLVDCVELETRTSILKAV